jgi:hypothetical protein
MANDIDILITIDIARQTQGSTLTITRRGNILLWNTITLTSILSHQGRGRNSGKYHHIVTSLPQAGGNRREGE